MKARHCPVFRWLWNRFSRGEKAWCSFWRVPKLPTVLWCRLRALLWDWIICSGFFGLDRLTSKEPSTAFTQPIDVFVTFFPSKCKCYLSNSWLFFIMWKRPWKWFLGGGGLCFLRVFGNRSLRYLYLLARSNTFISHTLLSKKIHQSKIPKPLSNPKNTLILSLSDKTPPILMIPPPSHFFGWFTFYFTPRILSA